MVNTNSFYRTDALKLYYLWGFFLKQLKKKSKNFFHIISIVPLDEILSSF